MSKQKLKPPENKFLKKSLITSIQLKFTFAVIWYFASILPISSLDDLTTAVTSHLLQITLLAQLVTSTSPLRNMVKNRRLKYPIFLGFMKGKRTLNQGNSIRNSTITDSKPTRNKIKVKIVNILPIINKSSNNLNNISLRITIIRAPTILIKMCLSLSISLSLGTTTRLSLAKFCP